MVSQNFGYAWLPSAQIKPYLKNNTLKPLNLEQGTTRSLKLYLMCTDNDRLGPVGQAFTQHLISLCNNEPG